MPSDGFAVVPQTLKDADSRLAWACELRSVNPSSFIVPIPHHRFRCRLCHKSPRRNQKTLERHLKTKSHLRAVALELQVDFKSLCGPPMHCAYCEKTFVAVRQDSLKRHEKSCKRSPDHERVISGPVSSVFPPNEGSTSPQEAVLSPFVATSPDFYVPDMPTPFATPNDYPHIIPPVRPDAPGPYSRSVLPSLFLGTVAQTGYHAGPSTHTVLPSSPFDATAASSLHTPYGAVRDDVSNHEGLPFSFGDWSWDAGHVDEFELDHGSTTGWNLQIPIGRF